MLSSAKKNIILINAFFFFSIENVNPYETWYLLWNVLNIKTISCPAICYYIWIYLRTWLRILTIRYYNIYKVMLCNLKTYISITKTKLKTIPCIPYVILKWRICGNWRIFKDYTITYIKKTKAYLVNFFLLFSYFLLIILHALCEALNIY